LQPEINDALMKTTKHEKYLKSQRETLQQHGKITCISFAKQGRTFVVVVMFIAEWAVACLWGRKFLSSSPAACLWGEQVIILLVILIIVFILYIVIIFFTLRSIMCLINMFFRCQTLHKNRNNNIYWLLPEKCMCTLRNVKR
jgi:ABC-type multidrug transport system fused ATPase/permease subunit